MITKQNMAAALLCVCALFGAGASAADIPWATPAYTLVARDMDLRTALDTFAVAEGVPLMMSDSVQGTFSGDFKDVPPADFLKRIATVHNLAWYYDGAALYLYGAGEIATMLIDLQYMKAGEVRQMLVELGVEDARYPLKTASNDELVMVSGPPRYVQLVAEMVAKADKLREKRNFSEVEARIFPLRYTWADDVKFNASSPESTATIKGVAGILRDIMNGEVNLGVAELPPEEAAKIEAARVTGFKPMISAENRLNAVIVRDISSRMGMYEKLIEKFDVPQKLIEIDITIVEMSQKNALDWQLSIAGTGTRGRNQIGAGQNAVNLFDPESVAGQGLAGAITHLGSHYNLSASLTAMRERGKTRSISRTQLLTVNNLAAQMTDTQSYHTKVIGTEVATLQEVSAGTTIQLKPRILPAISTNIPNQVWLSLQLDDGGFEAITVDAMPMTRSSTLTTQTAVFEEESILLAGYLREIEENAGWGIPFLRDIPIIGWLFGGKSTRRETVQRMFVITPHIVDLDKETLIRLQATHLRDLSVARELQKDPEEEEKDEEEDAEEGDAEEEEDAEKEESSPGADEAQRVEEENLRKVAEAQSKEYNGAKLEPIVIEVAAPAEKTEAFPPAPELDLQGVSVEK